MQYLCVLSRRFIFFFKFYCSTVEWNTSCITRRIDMFILYARFTCTRNLERLGIWYKTLYILTIDQNIIGYFQFVKKKKKKTTCHSLTYSLKIIQRYFSLMPNSNGFNFNMYVACVWSVYYLYFLFQRLFICLLFVLISVLTLLSTIVRRLILHFKFERIYVYTLYKCISRN